MRTDLSGRNRIQSTTDQRDQPGYLRGHRSVGHDDVMDATFPLLDQRDWFLGTSRVTQTEGTQTEGKLRLTGAEVAVRTASVHEHFRRIRNFVRRADQPFADESIAPSAVVVEPFAWNKIRVCACVCACVSFVKADERGFLRPLRPNLCWRL